MSVIDELKAQITSGRIIFDPPPNKLKKELLGENDGTKASELLQKLVIEVSRLQKIRISSVVRNAGHHGEGRAFDVGNEEIAAMLLPAIATDARVEEFRIDEIIFDATIAGQSDRNHWNYDVGRKHDYDKATLDQHKNHIHFAVKAG